MNLGEMFGEREVNLAIEVDDEDSLEDIEERWKQRFAEEGITVSPAKLEDFARRTYTQFFDANGNVRPENVERR